MIMDNNITDNRLQLREVQIAELNILRAFDGFCRANGLKYSLVGGTLLGAVRHKGFIPWDDDIDVGMPRPDYEKFVGLLADRKYILADNMLVITDRGKSAKLPYLKIVDKTITVPATVEAKVENLWIDVFPFDGCPSDEKKAVKHLKKAKHLRHIIVYNQFKSSHFMGVKKKLVFVACAAYAKMYGLHRAINNLYKLATEYDFDKAQNIAGVVWGLYGKGEIIAGDSFDDLIEFDFEGEKFYAMKNYDEYLSGLYGDYMTPPTEDKRYTHNLVAYRNDKNEEKTA